MTFKESKVIDKKYFFKGDFYLSLNLKIFQKAMGIFVIFVLKLLQSCCYDFETTPYNDKQIESHF